MSERGAARPNGRRGMFEWWMVAAVSAVGPVFIVGLGLPEDVEARKTAGFSLVMPAGQVVAGALVGWAATAGWSFADRFWLAAVFCAVLAAATWSAARRPEQELHAVLYPDGVDDADKAGAGKAGADKENGLVGWEVYLAAWSGSADRRGDRSRMIAAESAHLELT